MNVAYKHLDTKLRIADLSIAQWLGILAGVGVGIIWGFVISPLGGYATLVSAVYLGAMPAGAALLASATEFDLWLLARSALSWRRVEGRYVRGAGGKAQGYVLRENPHDLALRRRRQQAAELDLQSLWEESRP